MVNFVATTRRWYRQGIVPRDAGDPSACQMTVSQPPETIRAVFLCAFYITFNREFHRVDKFAESSIIGSINNGTAVNNVHYIGKLNLEIFKCVTDDIVTDEVIITDERVQHIKEHHPNDYETYYGFLNQIIEEPDYIIEANKPKSALVLKSFTEGSNTFKTIVRLVTSSDEDGIKNSIITFMKINEKEWNRLIKNKKVLYKRE